MLYIYIHTYTIYIYCIYIYTYYIILYILLIIRLYIKSYIQFGNIWPVPASIPQVLRWGHHSICCIHKKHHATNQLYGVNIVDMCFFLGRIPHFSWYQWLYACY